MKKIFLIVLFCISFVSTAFSDYGNAMKQVQIGNYSKAVDELREVVDTDDKSQYLMGYMYYNGLGVEQNYRKALDYFERSANAGNSDAQTFLAYMYDEGKGVQVDKKRAFDLYQMASDAGNVTATMNLAVMYYKGNGVLQNYDKSFALMSSIENVRNPMVQFYLGNLYFYGFGITKDEAKAVLYYIRAAQLGSPDAHYMLGYAYQNGIGVKRDLTKATKYYEYAAMKKHPQAQFNLATMYADGQTGSVDKVLAYVWFSAAVENDLSEAKTAISKLSETMSILEISRAKEKWVDLNKKLVADTDLESISMTENLGDMAFKNDGFSVANSDAVSRSKTSKKSGSSKSKDVSVRVRSPRMLRRR